jgi:hypothetical protein
MPTGDALRWPGGAGASGRVQLAGRTFQTDFVSEDRFSILSVDNPDRTVGVAQPLTLEQLVEQSRHHLGGLAEVLH